MKKRPAVFFDRDGVLNLDRGYLYRWEDFEWMPGAMEAIKLLTDQGYLLFVVTNQSGIARGFYQEEDVYKLHGYMAEEVEQRGGAIHSFYFCPHHPDGIIEKYTKACDCRKPLPGLIQQACQEWPVDLNASFLIGDMQRDLDAANGAGIPGYLFSEGNLYDFVQDILKNR